MTQNQHLRNDWVVSFSLHVGVWIWNNTQLIEFEGIHKPIHPITKWWFYRFTLFDLKLFFIFRFLFTFAVVSECISSTGYVENNVSFNAIINISTRLNCLATLFYVWIKQTATNTIQNRINRNRTNTGH